MKHSRWYKIKGKQAFIFDNGYEDKSQSISIVPKEQLSYYRNNFNLQKVWGLSNA